MFRFRVSFLLWTSPTDALVKMSLGSNHFSCDVRCSYPLTPRHNLWCRTWATLWSVVIIIPQTAKSWFWCSHFLKFTFPFKTIPHHPLLAVYNCFLTDLICVCSYVQIQVQARSHEIWNGEDGLEKEKEYRSQSREKKKLRKYAKEVKGMNVGSSVHLSLHSSAPCTHSKALF